MKVDVYSTEENVGDVIGDLNRRRGMISGQEPSAAGVRVRLMFLFQKCLVTLVPYVL